MSSEIEDEYFLVGPQHASLYAILLPIQLSLVITIELGSITGVPDSFDSWQP